MVWEQGEQFGTTAQLITERKRYLDGRSQSFECTLLRRLGQAAAIRFDHPPGAAASYAVPPGSYTIGYFWEGRRYNLYRIRDPAGGRIRDRFDIIRDCRISVDSIDYVDLFVDLVVDRMGRFTVEDEQELEESVAQGLLSAAERDVALLALAEVAGSYTQIIEAAEHIWPAARRE